MPPGSSRACSAAGRDPSPEEALALALPLEGHADNLGAALAGGVCLIWQRDGRHLLRRLADDLPLAPVLVVPGLAGEHARLARRGCPSTSATRRPPRRPPRRRCSERESPPRTPSSSRAPSTTGCTSRSGLPTRRCSPSSSARPAAGSVGVTLSGSGPSVVVWAEKGAEGAVAAELAARLDDVSIWPLAIAARGTHSAAVAAEIPSPAGLGASR